MTQGNSKGTIILYTVEGVPVNVNLVNNIYSLSVTDDAVRRNLEEIILLLTDIKNCLLTESTQNKEESNVG